MAVCLRCRRSTGYARGPCLTHATCLMHVAPRVSCREKLRTIRSNNVSKRLRRDVRFSSAAYFTVGPEECRKIRPGDPHSDTTHSLLFGLLTEFQEGPAKFLRGSASSRQEGRTTMNFGNLLSASAERNPRRAAIVLEKESISHVLRPHAPP